VVKTASGLMKHPTTVEEAIESKEIKAAICRGIYRITKLHQPVSRLRNGAASRDRLDWQDLYGEVVGKLSDPSVGFAAADFSPAYAYGVARNSAGVWLRERMKERPRTKPVAEQENESVALQSVQFDPRLNPRKQQDGPESLPNTKGINAWEELLDGLEYDFLRSVLERFAETSPADHRWLIEYMTGRWAKDYTQAEHQRAARLRRKLRALYDEMDQELETDAEECSELGDCELALEAS
jgi:hypothetical protein